MFKVVLFSVLGLPLGNFSIRHCFWKVSWYAMD